MAAEPPTRPEETLRLHLASERTFLAWIRTGVRLMGFGFAIAGFGVFLRRLADAENIHVGAADALGSAWGGTALVGRRSPRAGSFMRWAGSRRSSGSCSASSSLERSPRGEIARDVDTWRSSGAVERTIIGGETAQSPYMAFGP